MKEHINMQREEKGLVYFYKRIQIIDVRGMGKWNITTTITIVIIAGKTL
jgi:hypothetical protein